jgi:hypothetical protein
MWLPGMKVRDEKGHPVGLLAFQLFGVRFLIVNIKSPACGGFLCDDMGLGKTTRGLAVGQILHNLSQLSYLLTEAIPRTVSHSWSACPMHLFESLVVGG